MVYNVELLGTALGTHWEQENPTPTPYPKIKKILGLVGACCLTSLVASMFLQVLA